MTREWKDFRFQVTQISGISLAGQKKECREQQRLWFFELGVEVVIGFLNLLNERGCIVSKKEEEVSGGLSQKIKFVS